MNKYVWLDINTGKFSNSWDEETHKNAFGEDLNPPIFLKESADKGHYIIKYECINKNDFEFYEQMKLK